MEYETYGIRWFILTAIGVCVFSNEFMSESFAVVKDVVSEYFHITAYQTDLLTVIDSITATVVCAVIAFAGDAIGLRRQFLLMLTSMIIGSGLSLIGVFSRELYWCVLLGRLISGIATGIYYFIPPLLSSIWFPPKELATAFAIPVILGNIGMMLSSVLIPQELPQYNFTSYRNITPDEEDKLSAERVKNVFVIPLASLFAAICLSSLVLIRFTEDKPPTPPSAAQDRIRRHAVPHRSWNELFSCTSITSTLRNLFTNKLFIVFSAVNALGSSSGSLVYIISPSTIKATFPSISFTTVGYMLLAADLGGVLGLFSAGRFLDKFRRFKGASLVGNAFMIAICVALVIGHSTRSLLSLFVFYPALLFFHMFTYITYAEFMIETTYPFPKGVLMPMYYSLYNLGLFGFTSMERLAMKSFNEIGAVIVTLAANVVAFALLMTTKADYRRSDVNEGKLLAEDTDIPRNIDYKAIE